MATFLKRNNRWRVQIRRTGYPSITKTFAAKADAQAWARDKERQIDRGELPTNHHELKQITVGDLLRRYREDITPKKRSPNPERYMIGTMLAHPLALVQLRSVCPKNVTEYRDHRLQIVSASSVHRELAILQHCFNLAIKEWGVPLTANPCALVSKPTPAKARTRRLEAGEPEKLNQALAQCQNPLMRSVFLFALATGMRRGEVLSLEWENVDLEARTAHLPITKNGSERTVPLSPAAIEVLEQLPHRTGVCFPISGNAVRLAWERVKTRAGIDGLHWHDLRREACSRFFEQGLSTQEVQLISGHKDIRMLSVYTRLKPEAVALKLT